MATISKPNTFSAGATIIASEHNANFDTIYSDYNGNITNANIAGGAAIAYSKLSLALSLVNADISASAAIVGSKLDLTSVGAIGSVARGSGAFTTLSMGTTRQGDVLYDNGTSLVRLAPGTSGNFLQTLGGGANPQWATGVLIYSAGSSSRFTASTDRTTTSASYVKLKEIFIDGSGTLRISFDLSGDGTPGHDGVAKIYRNGVAVGTERTVSDTATYSTFNEDISGWTPNDLCQIYAHQNGSGTAHVKNVVVSVQGVN